MSFKTRFSNLGHPNKIWVVSAVHGQQARLVEIHKTLFDKFRSGDRVVYTGNYLCGQDASPIETLGEILHFRSALLTQKGVEADDIVYLRGIQEELFSKLLQLQFAPNAEHVVDWMSRNHPEVGLLLQAYGTSFEEASRISREGILCLTKWSNAIKSRMRDFGNHEQFFTHLRRAAFTDHRQSNDNNLLFVHAGLNPHLPLVSQGDSFWWSSRHFNDIGERYAPFRAVIRGHDPERKGVHIGSATISIDGGCGHGGKLVLAQISNIGEVVELIAA